MPPILANRALDEHVPTDGRSDRQDDDILKQNALLDIVREAGDELCTLIAAVRWLLFEQTREEHAGELDIGKQTVDYMENPLKNTSQETYARVYRLWGAAGVPKETLEKLLQLLIQREYDRRGRKLPMENEGELDERPLYTMNDLYMIWKYQCGFKKFEDASEKAWKGGRLTNKTMGLRKTFPSYDEARSQLPSATVR